MPACNPATASAQVSVRPRDIESASASTACQTTDSKFAYFLTAGILGVLALVALGITLLVFAAVATWDAASGDRTQDGQDYYRYEDGYGQGESPEEDWYGRGADSWQGTFTAER